VTNISIVSSVGDQKEVVICFKAIEIKLNIYLNISIFDGCGK
jgi:hypothetical protein